MRSKSNRMHLNSAMAAPWPDECRVVDVSLRPIGASVCYHLHRRSNPPSLFYFKLSLSFPSFFFLHLFRVPRPPALFASPDIWISIGLCSFRQQPDIEIDTDDSLRFCSAAFFFFACCRISSFLFLFAFLFRVHLARVLFFFSTPMPRHKSPPLFASRHEWFSFGPVAVARAHFHFPPP